MVALETFKTQHDLLKAYASHKKTFTRKSVVDGENTLGRIFHHLIIEEEGQDPQIREDSGLLGFTKTVRKATGLFGTKKVISGELFTNSKEEEDEFKRKFKIYRNGQKDYAKITRGKLLISPKSNNEIGTIGIFFKKSPKSQKVKDIQFNFAFTTQGYKEIMKII